MMQSLDAYLIDKSIQRSSLEKPLKNIVKAFKDGILQHKDFTDMDFCIYFIKKIDNAFKKVEKKGPTSNSHTPLMPPVRVPHNCPSPKIKH